MSTAHRPKQYTFPAELLLLCQWVCWKFLGAERRKTPYQVSGIEAKSNTPSTWASYEDVLKALSKRSSGYEGPGFVFSKEDPYVGIDLDDCLNPDGSPKPWVGTILARFPDTYWEISPSGKGLKGWIRGKLPGAGIGRTKFHDGGVEIYDQGRFFTITGNVYADAPLQITEHQVSLDWLLGAIGKTPKPKQTPAATPISITTQRRASVRTMVNDALQAAGDVGRNRAGYDLAQQMYYNNYSESEALQVVLNDYRPRTSNLNVKGEPLPYTEGEAKTSVRSAYSGVKKEPWGPSTRSGAPSSPSKTLVLPGPTQPVLTEIIQKVIDSKNVVNCFEAAVVDHLAKLSTGAYYVARKTLKDEFGSDMDLTLLNSAIREAKQTIAWETNSKQRTQTLAPLPVRTRGGRPTAVDVALVPGMFNDEGNAQRLLAAYGHGMRHVHAMKKWLIWDQRRWLVDEAGEARELARDTMVRFLNQAVKERDDAARKFANSSIDEKRITTCLANAQDKHKARPAELDTDPYLLNFLNGTLDLRTGELRPHRPEDLITKLVHFNYNPKAQCSTFLKFLEEIMGGGPDVSEGEMDRADRMITWLQKAFGYSMTGVTNEKVVFIAHGVGNNGKSTLISLFRALLDEYSVLLKIDSLMTRSQEDNNSQADLADLRGARFCMTSETEEGQRLAEGKLKRITQGMGKIKATRKYENPIEFPETHKLWMDGNHRPNVRGSDQAIWNRLRLIPFEVVVQEIDEHLPQKLMAEAEGILAWAVRGGIRWYQERLGKPPELEAAAADWRSNMDPLKDWVEEKCEIDVKDKTRYISIPNLRQSYEDWAEASGEKYLLDRKKYIERLEQMGLKQGHDPSGKIRVWLGIRFRKP